MKFTADASAIKKALDLIRPGDPARHALPHDGGVQIEARGKSVVVLSTCGTYQGRWESIRVPGQEVAAVGTVVLPFGRFKRLMGAMKDESVEFDVDENHVTMTSGKTVVTIKPSTADRMPATPMKGASAVQIQLHGGALAEALRFSSRDESRPVLNTVFYDGGSYVSTDSYRLSVVDVPEHAWDGEFMIPRNAAEAMGRLGDPKFFTAWTDQTHMWADHGDAQVVTRLREGQFPGYKQLIPEGGRGAAKITEELRDAALKIHRLATAVGHGWEWGTPVKITQADSTSVVLTIANDENVIEIKALGQIGHTVGFNPKYLADFFTGTNVDSMFGQDSLKPWGLEEAADYCSGAKRMRLLMPVRTS